LIKILKIDPNLWLDLKKVLAGCRDFLMNLAGCRVHLPLQIIKARLYRLYYIKCLMALKTFLQVVGTLKFIWILQVVGFIWEETSCREETTAM